MVTLTRICLLICLLLQAGMHASAQSKEVQPKEAREILAHTESVFMKSGGFQVEFSMTTQGQTLEGMIFLKGEKFVLEVGGVKTWFDGHTQWSYVVENEEVNVSVPTSDELNSLNPYAWISMYRTAYRLQLGKGTTHCHEVTMQAISERQNPQTFCLWIDKRSYYPQLIQLKQIGQEVVTDIAVKNYQSSQTYPDSFFVFDPKLYPQAEVIDLR